MNHHQSIQFRTITLNPDTEHQRNIRIPVNVTNQNQFNGVMCPHCGRNYIGNFCSYVDCIRINQLNILTQQIYNDRIANINLLSDNESNRILIQCQNIARRQINFTNSLVPRY